MMERIVGYGITLNRTSNCWNDYEVFREELKGLRSVGMNTVVNLIYSVSPRHTDAYYARKAREAAALKPYAICFKDVGGLLTPERTRALVPLVLKNAGDVPVEFHAHCNNGLAPLCYLEAVKLGMKTLHTAIPPLANGSSQPSVYNVAQNLRALGYAPAIDESVLQPVTQHFSAIAKNEGLPIGTPVEYDQAQYLHQVPGGMISNLRHQLKLVGMEQKLDATLVEAVQARADFGYPIMVTPLSQVVGSQAAINVIVGERYREVTDQTIQYALGLWGKEGAALMDTNIKDKILNRARAKEIANAETPQASLKELRQKFGGQGVADEEILMRFFTGKEEVEKMRAAGPTQMYTVTQNPLLNLIEELAKQPNHNSIYFRKGDLSIRLVRRRMS